MEEWMAFFDDPGDHPLAIMAQVQAWSLAPAAGRPPAAGMSAARA